MKHSHIFCGFVHCYRIIELQSLSGSLKPIPVVSSPTTTRPSLGALHRLWSCHVAQQKTLHLGTVVAKKLILLKWKSTTPPCFKHWLTVTHYRSGKNCVSTDQTRGRDLRDFEGLFESLLDSPTGFLDGLATIISAVFDSKLKDALLY